MVTKGDNAGEYSSDATKLLPRVTKSPDPHHFGGLNVQHILLPIA